MKEWDITEAMQISETPETRAYDHALDIAFMVAEEMEKQNIGKKELAERMGMSLPQLSKLLNTQPNMTLETIARFELALGINLAFTFKEKAGKADNFDIEDHVPNIRILYYDQVVPSRSAVAYDGANTQDTVIPGRKLRFAA